MYADPKHKRVYPIKVRYTEEQLRIIEAVADFRRTQPATLLHDLTMQLVEEMEKELPEDIKRVHRIK